jgi:hypothetical protein
MRFLAERRKLWLSPFIVVAVLLVCALLLSKRAAIVPFIYSIF